MQMFLTILAGVFVFIISQYILKFILEPLKELKEIISKVNFSLTYYANVYSNIQVISKEDRIEMRDEIRKLASSLYAEAHSIILYSLFYRLFSLPSKENIDNAKGTLIGLSNTHDNEDYKYIEKRVSDIKEYLNFKK